MPGAFAATADELFEDGNRLFREDLYWAALLRYRQAADAGLDSALLHYNTGVAHYRAGQFDRARRAFDRALAEPKLVPRVHYNLGLTEYAAGNDAAALARFRQVREQSADPTLAELAAMAIERVSRAARRKSPPAVVREMPAARRKLGELELRATAGIGNDDNVYRTPAEPYADRSQAGSPTVTPLVRSGAYYPVDVLLKYSVNSFEHESFFGSYRVAGRYYQDPELNNANEFAHELAFGSDYRRHRENRERKVYSAFTIAQHDETWVDPDDGTERSISGETVGNRLSYVRYGPELWLRQSFSRLSFNVHGKGQIWNYEHPQQLPEYDHEYLSAGASAQYRFTSTSLIRLSADAYQRRFGERPSYDLDGQQPIGNPAVRYDYAAFAATARQRITRAMWFGLNYERTTRSDRHRGYNDYVRDDYGAEFSLRLSERFRLHAGATYRIYGYTNAFAFHNPAAGRKTLETADARLLAYWRLTGHLSLSGEFDYRDLTSNDARIAYTRGRFMLGIRWRQ